MVKQQWAVLWTYSSNKNLRDAFDALSEYTGSNSKARVIVSEIYDYVEELNWRALHFEEDRFKVDNDGSFKACEKNRYRISYKIENNIVVILRIRQAQKDPIYY